MANKNNIKFSNVSLSHKNVTFEIKNLLELEIGKKYALVAPSGGGKSLFLSLLAGYPFMGWIGKKQNIEKFSFFGFEIIDECFLSNLSLRKSFTYNKIWKTVFLPQYLPNVRYVTNVSSEITFILKSIDFDITKSEIDEVKKNIQKLIGNDVLSKNLLDLSGGERRRVELFVRISAISSYSKKHENTKILLLLDEPTTGFDMRSEREFFNLIGDEFGKIKNNAILVFSTHALYLLKENIADEIVILEKSKFKKQGVFLN